MRQPLRSLSNGGTDSSPGEPRPNSIQMDVGSTPSERSMRVGGILLKHVTNVEESGGMFAPDEAVERGYDYTSYVRPESREATIQAWITREKYDELTQLRKSSEPFRTTIGFLSIPKCKLDDLSVTREAEKTSHLQCTLSVTQVREARPGTTTLHIQTDSTSKSGSSELKHPSVVDETEDEGDEETTTQEEVMDHYQGGRR